MITHNPQLTTSLQDTLLISDNIISSLGFTTEENMTSFREGHTGIKLYDDQTLAPAPFWASRVDDEELSRRFTVFGNPSGYTRFERLVICSVKDALSRCTIDITGKRTLFILSTTKGNIDLLKGNSVNRFEESRTYLWYTAHLLQRFFSFHTVPLIVSNACISGVLAIIEGARLIRANLFDTVIVTGADLVTEFVLSGFNSFQSLSKGPCRPFDKNRQGLSLGEGAGTVILSGDVSLALSNNPVKAGYGCSANDANHISGPSRTGEGLYLAIKHTLERSSVPVDYISAHGTATPYNDEMESVALNRAGLQDVPVNSFKGYWGHTLGAAGVIESAAGAYSLANNILFQTLGYEEPGVTQAVAVIDKTVEKNLGSFLKIASGFGGCNAALMFHK
jgi:3-oxoacyl-[acyl-carrier-protein] synthase-1